jgi:hypothetical protein
MKAHVELRMSEVVLARRRITACPRPVSARLSSPGGHLVIMDAKLPSGVLDKLLHHFVVWTSKLTVLGNPDVRPWDELRSLNAEIEYEEAQFGTYYICRARKR